MKENLKNLILKKKLNEKKPKYGKRKLSVGLVSCLLAFSIFTPFLVNTNLNVKADTVAGPVEPAPAPPPAPGDNGDNVFEGITLPKEVRGVSKRLDEEVNINDILNNYKKAILDLNPTLKETDIILAKGPEFNNINNIYVIKNGLSRKVGYEKVTATYEYKNKLSAFIPSDILFYSLPFWKVTGNPSQFNRADGNHNVDKIKVKDPNNYILTEIERKKIKDAFISTNKIVQTSKTGFSFNDKNVSVDEKGNIKVKDDKVADFEISSNHTVSVFPKIDEVILFSKKGEDKKFPTNGEFKKSYKLKDNVTLKNFKVIQTKVNSDASANKKDGNNFDYEGDMFGMHVKYDKDSNSIVIFGKMIFDKNAASFNKYIKVSVDGEGNLYRDVSNRVAFRTVGISQPETIYRDIDEENSKVTKNELETKLTEIKNNASVGTTNDDDKKEVGGIGKQNVIKAVRDKIQIELTDGEFNKVNYDTKKVYVAKGKLKYDTSESPDVELKVRYFTKNFKVLVDNPNSLTQDDLNKIKAKAAKVNGVNEDKVTVESNGKVEITFEDGTKKDLGTSHVLKLNPPKLTKVKKKDTLTEKEKADVIAAIKTANTELAEDFKNNNLTVEHDSDGNVIVKDKYGETLKSFTKDETVIALPALTNVDNTNSLTETEKNAVKAAIKKANTNLGDDVTIDVEANGKTIVKKGNDVLVEFEPNETIKEKDTPNVTIKQKDNGDLEIVVKDSENKAYPKGSTIAIKTGDGDTNADYINGKVVDEKGTVIIKNDKLPTEELKNKEFKALKDSVISKPVQVTVPKKLDFKVKEIEVEKGTEKDKIDAKNGLGENFSNSDKVKSVVFNQDSTPNTDTVTPNGTEPTKYKATVTFNDGSTTEIEIPVKVVDKTAPGAPTVKAEDDGSVTVTPPADTDATEMTIKYKNDGEDKEITVTKGTDGKWKLPDSNPDGLTIDENGVVTIPEDKVDDKTDVTAKAKDDSENESTEAKAKAKSKPTPPAPKPQPNPSVPGNNGKNDNNGNKGNNGNNGNNGNTGSNGENNGENNGNVNTQKPQIKAPDKKVKVKDPNKLTKEEKQRVEKEIRDKNKDLPKDSKVEISDNGDVVVKDKDNKVIGKLNGKDLIEKKKKIATEKNIKKKLPKTNVEGTSLVYTILSGLSLLAFKRRKRK